MRPLVKPVQTLQLPMLEHIGVVFHLLGLHQVLCTAQLAIKIARAGLRLPLGLFMISAHAYSSLAIMFQIIGKLAQLHRLVKLITWQQALINGGLLLIKTHMYSNHAIQCKDVSTLQLP